MGNSLKEEYKMNYEKTLEKHVKRIGEMPKEVRTLFGEEHEQSTLESKMPEYKKIVLKMHS